MRQQLPLDKVPTTPMTKLSGDATRLLAPFKFEADEAKRKRYANPPPSREAPRGSDPDKGDKALSRRLRQGGYEAGVSLQRIKTVSKLMRQRRPVLRRTERYEDE